MSKKAKILIINEIREQQEVAKGWSGVCDVIIAKNRKQALSYLQRHGKNGSPEIIYVKLTAQELLEFRTFGVGTQIRTWIDKEFLLVGLSFLCGVRSLVLYESIETGSENTSSSESEVYRYRWDEAEVITVRVSRKDNGVVAFAM